MINMLLRLPHRYDLGNPATMLVPNSAPEFGITIPHYNNLPAFRSAGRFGGSGQPLPMSTPVVADIVNANVPGYSFQGTMTARAEHDIAWQIHLAARPQNGIAWETRTHESHRLWKFIEALFMNDQKLVNEDCRKWVTEWRYLSRFTITRELTVRLIPRPSAHAFMEHLLAHEYQHVEDHAWLARKIIGPLSDWQDQFLQRQFLANSKLNFHSVNLANTAETATRIMEYWQRAMEQSGELFHHTPAGAHPIIRVERIVREDRNDGRTTGEVDFSVTPALLLSNLGCALDGPRPHCGPDNLFKIATSKIGGNEPTLSYVPVANFVARKIKFGHIVNQFLALESPEEEGEGEGGDLGLGMLD